MDEILSRVVNSRNYREQLLASKVLPQVDFLCVKCRKMAPFAGDVALEYYGDRGLTLVCNDCLVSFERKLLRTT